MNKLSQTERDLGGVPSSVLTLLRSTGQDRNYIDKYVEYYVQRSKRTSGERRGEMEVCRLIEPSEIGKNLT
jgi:hypothetical protein